MVKLASRKNASRRCLVSCFVPIVFDGEEKDNGRVVTLECSAGKRCVLASAWRFVWRLNPSGLKTFLGCDEMEELTQEQITPSKKERNQLPVSQQGSVRGPSSVSRSFRSVTDPHRWLYNIGGINPIGPVVRALHLPIPHSLQSEHVRANRRQRWSRSTWFQRR